MARILLVDDEAQVLQSVGMLIKTEGHEVVATTDGTEAKQLLLDDKFDVFVTDIRMSPVDGMELVKLCHEKHPDTPIIVVSAYSSDGTIEESFRHGCAAYIKKPFRIEQVLDAIKEALKTE